LYQPFIHVTYDMEKDSASWVFPTVKGLVSVSYYFIVAALVFFTLISTFKLLSLQLENVTVQTNYVSLGGEAAGYVSIPVAWEAFDTQISESAGQPPIYLKTQQHQGQLQVPILSWAGILVVLLCLVGLVAAGWTFLLLRRIFARLQARSLFRADNARRIETLGVLFLGQTLIEIVLKLALVFQSRPFFQQIKLNQVDLHVNIDLDGPWLLGLILLALAQIYRQGIKFQLENESTI
jgi:hypothetical protein